MRKYIVRSFVVTFLVFLIIGISAFEHSVYATELPELIFVPAGHCDGDAGFRVINPDGVDAEFEWRWLGRTDWQSGGIVPANGEVVFWVDSNWSLALIKIRWHDQYHNKWTGRTKWANFYTEFCPEKEDPKPPKRPSPIIASEIFDPPPTDGRCFRHNAAPAQVYPQGSGYVLWGVLVNSDDYSFDGVYFGSYIDSVPEPRNYPILLTEFEGKYAPIQLWLLPTGEMQLHSQELPPNQHKVYDNIFVCYEYERVITTIPMPMGGTD